MFRSSCRKLYDLLDRRERFLGMLVFGLMVLVALTDTLGVASIMPFIAVVANPDIIESNHYLAVIYHGIGFVSKESFLLYLGLTVFLVLIVSLALRAFSFWVQLRFSNMRNHALGYRLVAAYLGQPYHWFLNRHSADMAASVLQEVSQVVNGALFPAMQVITNILIVSFILSLLIAVDPFLAAMVVIVLGGAYGLIFLFVRHYLSRIGEEGRLANRARFHVVQEAFGGIKDVKIAGLEAIFLERFRGPSTRFAVNSTTSKIIAELPAFAMQGLVFGGMIMIILYLMSHHGGFQQALPVIALYAFGGYRLMPALQAIYGQLAQLRYTEPTLDNLHRDTQALGSVEESNHAHERMGLESKFELCDVRYSYPNARRTTLQHMNLSISARTTVALVGSSGSGKTTVADLILGLLRPDAGCLKVDGQEITAANIRAWQRTLGYVPQHVYLTDETVAANIAFGLPGDKIDIAKVERAARIANLHEFVMTELPDGYNTTVGERGVRLSGGQRQRIGIARALYHDPEVIILDEATSALDNRTERAVMEAVHNLSHSKTVILIAHRLTTVQECDQIYVLERGRIVGCGTYDQLMANNETFRQIAGTIKQSNLGK